LSHKTSVLKATRLKKDIESFLQRRKRESKSMQKKSYDALKYTNYSKYHVINVWAKEGERERIVK